MRTRVGVGWVLVVALYACGDDGANPTGVTYTPSEDVGPPPQSVTLQLDAFELAPGGEVYYCQHFINPFGRVAVDIGAFESHMSTGSHHMQLNRESVGTNTGLEVCDGLNMPVGPYASQTPDAELVMPPGVAARLLPGQGFMLQVHYLNTSSATITPTVTVSMSLATGPISAYVKYLLGYDLNVSIAPHSTGHAGSSVVAASDMHLIAAAGHMHRYGVRFTAKTPSDVLIDQDGWEVPATVYSPPKLIPRGTSIAFSCSYVNDTSSTLIDGESAATNEMCSIGGIYY